MARPGPRPNAVNTRPESTNTRPNANKTTRPEAAQLYPRPNPERSEGDLARPERPVSRCPSARQPISPYTDWSSLLNEAEVLTGHSDDSDNNYVARSPAYELDSPGPNPQETEDWNPTPGDLMTPVRGQDIL